MTLRLCCNLQTEQLTHYDLFQIVVILGALFLVPLLHTKVKLGRRQITTKYFQILRRQEENWLD